MKSGLNPSKCAPYSQAQRGPFGTVKTRLLVQKVVQKLPAIVALVALLASSSMAAAEWQRVANWTGNGTKQTESFSVASREWRISWETTNEAFKGAGIFQIYVYDDEDKLVTLAANKQGVGKDTSYVRAAPGRFHLMINSGNVDWSVVVEDQR